MNNIFSIIKIIQKNKTTQTFILELRNQQSIKYSIYMISVANWIIEEPASQLNESILFVPENIYDSPHEYKT